MQVILLEKIRKLGSIGNVVNVKDGYGRNYLIPQKKALRATPKNIEYFENQKEKYAQRNEENKKEAETLCASIDGLTFEFITAAQNNGKLYGSVTVREIAEKLNEKGFKVLKSKIDLPVPITEIGLYEVPVVLHPEISCKIKVVIGSTQEEIHTFLGEAIQ